LILVVVIVVTARGGSEIFLGLRRGTHFVLVQGDEVANNPIVELEGSLVLGESGGLGGELGDDVVAVFLGANGVGELAPSPMGDFRLLRGVQESVEAADFFVDGGVFESRIEDVDRLVCARHSAILLLGLIRLPLVAEAGGRCEGRNTGRCENAKASRKGSLIQLLGTGFFPLSRWILRLRRPPFQTHYLPRVSGRWRRSAFWGPG